MTELVINSPHLQTVGQRLGAAALNIIGWLLWCYFFFPLVSLGCWFMDFDQCSQWVNLSGGYLNLQDILLVYIESVAALGVAWIAWVAYNLATRSRRQRLPAPPPVSRAELCRTFNVPRKDLDECQESRFVVVHFDPSGQIIGLERVESRTPRKTSHLDKLDANGSEKINLFRSR